MRNFAVFGAAQSTEKQSNAHTVIEGIGIDCRIVETADPAFDPNLPMNRSRVLVRKSAFSLNYRDRAYVLGTALSAPPNTFAVLGSEFSGEVVTCGTEVEDLHHGVRVMGNNCYPADKPGLPEGLPGNRLSRELEVIPASKLMRIPDTMTDIEAAGFAVGAQTIFSIIRKLALLPGSVVLVAGGRSNTSLFAIKGLSAQGLNPPVKIYVSTTSAESERLLLDMGVAGVIRIDANTPSFLESAKQPVIEENGGFDAVIDPFCDVHLVPAVQVLKQGGRYITCGIYDQTGHLRPGSRPVEAPGLNGIIGRMLVQNLHIMGNCLGLTSDLEAAIAAYVDGRFSVLVDSVYRDGDAEGFLNRSFISPERFGKVIYSYR